jgi:UPF0755 protein
MSPKQPRRRGSSCLFLFTVAALGAAAVTISFFLPAGKEGDFTLVAIPPGASVAEIGDILERDQVIRSATAFRLAVKLLKKERSLVSGEYKLSPGMSLYRVIQVLEKGRVVDAPVTFPEGVTVAQIADLLSNRGYVPEEDFLDLCHHGGGTFTEAAPFLESDNLEGYLFPDTYRFAKGIDARAIVAAMLSDFSKRMQKAAFQPTGLAASYSDYQILIMASLVEKEAKAPAERARIAGVLYNRLKLGRHGAVCAGQAQGAAAARRSQGRFALQYLSARRPPADADLQSRPGVDPRRLRP